jgi:hypothetical protein
MRRTNEESTSVNRSEHPAKTPSPESGFFAMLRCISSSLPGGRSSSAAVVSHLTLAAITATLALALITPSTASAHFVRPFLRQITGTTSGLFVNPGGLATDAADSLWIGDVVSTRQQEPLFQLDEFEYPSNTFIETLKLTSPEENPAPPASLAIDRSSTTAHFYITAARSIPANPPYVEIFSSTGAFVGRFGPFGQAQVAVDNSAEPSAGTVYVAEPGAVQKRNATGEPVAFEGCPGCSSYVSTNKITGYEGGSLNGENPGVAVDAKGDIYTTVSVYKGEGPAVLEYAPSGEFLRAFTGQETTGLGENHGSGGFGGHLGGGLAVDPNGDLLVAVDADGRDEGAVDEFDSAGHFLGQIAATASGAFASPGALAVDSHGDLYLVEGGHVDAYGEGAFVANLRLGEANPRTPTTATLNATVNPEALLGNSEHAGLTKCDFEYVTAAAFQATGFSDLSSGGEVSCTPSAAEIPADESFHTVHAALAGLTSGQTYRYRLSATLGGAHGGTAHTPALAFTAPHAPLIESTSVDNLSSTFADLDARINPLGAATAYRFEYLTAAEFQANGESFSGPDPAIAVPVPDADIGSGGGSGSSSEAVVQHIGGLQPATSYHFRVVATSEIGTTTGPDTTFATLPQVSPGLADGRAYELLTPPDKGSAEDMFGEPELNGEFSNQHSQGVSATSGDGFLLETHAAFGPFAASGNNAYVLSRAPVGWSATALASPSLGVQSLSGAVFDPTDLSQVAFNNFVGSGATEAGQRLTNLVGPPGGPYTTLHADQGTHGGKVAGEEKEVTEIVGASHGLGHVVLESKLHTLCAGAAAQDEGSRLLCEYSGSELKLLNVNGKGEPLSKCGAELAAGGTLLGPFGGTAHNAVSADGSRVLLTAPDPEMTSPHGPGGEGCWNETTKVNAPQLYMRSAGATVQVSKPEKGAPEPVVHHPAIYAGASEDGTRVFFKSEAELTKDDEGIHDSELYEYNVETAKLTRISHGESGKAAANVLTVPAISAGGSAVYFTAFARLTASAPEHLSGEEVDLYRYDTTAGTTTYVATVNTTDYPNHSGTCGSLGGREPGELVGCSAANWYATPDGRYLAFATSRELTGYGTAGPCAVLPSTGGQNNGHCDELYRYDSATAGLTCVSCNPSGAAPASNSIFSRSAPGNAASAPPRAISSDGSYVFFDTADALVPQDTNGTLDVYEWHDGAISLISSGHDSAPSFFLDSSPDGRDVFFGTHARLVSQDKDTQGDVYDARICASGDPCISPPPGETAQCEGDACQNPPPAPIDATPTSSTFSGAGNLASELNPQVAPKPQVKPKKCAKGKVRKKGKCVRKRQKRGKRASRTVRHNHGGSR